MIANGTSGIKANKLFDEGVGPLLKESNFRDSHSMDKSMSMKVNPKVLETWINETL
jgi:hypothetical protein